MPGETITVPVEISTDLLEFVAPPEVIADRLRQALVMELLRDVEISRGKAAELLGITAWDMLDLIGKYQIPSGPTTREELERDVENARLASDSVIRASS